MWLFGLRRGLSAFRAARSARKAQQAARQTSVLRRLFGLSAVGATGAGVGLGGRALLSKISEAFGKTEDQDLQQDAQDVTAVSQFAGDRETPQFERIRAVDLFRDVSVDSVDIVPELGPEGDRYEKHLNLIIERVANLESEVATQNSLINKLRGGTNKVFEQNRRAELAEKRQQTEDDIEKGFVRKNLEEVGDKVKSGVSDVTGAVARIGKTVASVAGLFLAGSVLQASAADEESERQRRTLEILREWTGGDDDDEFAEQEEFSFEDIVRSAATEAAAFTGATLGARTAIQRLTGGVGGFLSDARQAMTRAPQIPPATIGQTVTITNARGVQQQVQIIKSLDTLDSAGRPQIQVRPAGGGPLYAIPETQVPGGVQRPPAGVSPTGATSQVNRQKAGVFRRSIDKFLGLARAFFSKANQIITTLGTVVSRFVGVVGRVLKFALRHLTKLIMLAYVVYESIDLIKRNIQMFGEGEMSEEEFHDANKRQINRIVGELGLPILMGILGGKLGAALGSFAPILGNLTGAVAGLVVGVTFGIGAEYVFRASGMNRFLDAVYDSILVDDDAPLRGMVSSVSNWFNKDLKEKAGDVAKFVWSVTPHGLIIRGGQAAREAFLARRTNNETSMPSETITSVVSSEMAARQELIDSIIDVNESALRQYDPEIFQEYSQIREALNKDEAIQIMSEEILSAGAAVFDKSKVTEWVDDIQRSAAASVINQQSPSQQNSVVVPIIPPQVQYGQAVMDDMGSGPKSQLESASPTYDTSDSFLDLGLVT